MTPATSNSEVQLEIMAWANRPQNEDMQGAHQRKATAVARLNASDERQILYATVSESDWHRSITKQTPCANKISKTSDGPIMKEASRRMTCEITHYRITHGQFGAYFG